MALASPVSPAITMLDRLQCDREATERVQKSAWQARPRNQPGEVACEIRAALTNLTARTGITPTDNPYTGLQLLDTGKP